MKQNRQVSGTSFDTFREARGDSTPFQEKDQTTFILKFVL